MKTNIHFFNKSRAFLLRMRNVSDESYRENRNKHFVFSKLFFFENLVIYEKMWKNIVERGKTHMTIWRMRFSCCIRNVQIHTRRLCNTHCFSTAIMFA